MLPRRIALYYSVLWARTLLLLMLGFDLFRSFRFAEWFVCTSCELEPIGRSDSSSDAIHEPTGERVEIKSGHKIQWRNGRYACCFDNLDRHKRDGVATSCYVLIVFDLEGISDDMIRYFVIPSDETPDGGFLEIPVLSGDSDWLDYECSLYELPKKVGEAIDDSTSESDE